MDLRRGLSLVAVFVLLHSSSDELLLAPPAAPAPPPGATPAEPRPPTSGELLARRRLVVPVAGTPPSRLQDSFEARRGKGRRHEAIDIMAPWGTPVLAADDGRIEKITSNRGGGLTLYQVDPSGRFVYYYAHLAGYAEGLKEGQAVRRGDVIAYVGATGNADRKAPHLHFAVLLLTTQKRWWGGEAINPYPALAQAEPVTTARR
jgi:murein DD-endopeptidase MepM/ murein hydrolase activator NlpD